MCGNATGTGFGGNAFGQTNIDSGLAAVSSQTDKFEAIRTTSMMVHGTYFLPNDGKTWIGGGYGAIYSSNADQMTCTVSATACGGAVRTAAEYLYARFHVLCAAVPRFHSRNSDGIGDDLGVDNLCGPVRCREPPSPTVVLLALLADEAIAQDIVE